MSAAGDDAMRVTGQPRFAMVPLSVLERAPSPRAVQAFAVLAAHASNDDRRCWPGTRRLARMARCSTERIRAAIRELEEAGLVHVTKGSPRDGTPSTYDLRPAWDLSATGGVGDGPPRVGDGPRRTRGVTSFSSRKTPEFEDLEGEIKAVRGVVDYWREKLSPRAKVTPARMRRVRARLREGYSVEELRRAVDGCASSPFHREGHHTDLELIARSAAHVDRFIALAGERPSSGAGRPSASPRRRLTRDEEVLNDLTAAAAAAATPEDRAELEAQIATVRERIRAACDSGQATRTTDDEEDR